MKLSILSLGSLIPLAAAHFKLVYPPSRDRVEDKMPTYPCGGSPPTANRAQVSICNGTFPVALSMGHAQTAVEMLLALGTDPGDNFNITLVPTFETLGLGSFCLPEVPFNAAALGTRVRDGMNATLQVQTNGDPSGGLYACADIQFTTTALSSEPSSCKNNTGVTATPFPAPAANRNANESTPQGQPQDGGGSSGSSGSSGGSGNSDSGDGASVSQSNTGAGLQAAVWGVLGAAVVGGVAIL